MSSVMSWSTNCPKYVYPAGMTDTPRSAGLLDPGSGSRPGSPIIPPSCPSSAWLATLNGSFVAARTATDDLYPNRSAQEEISAGNGNQERASLAPWKRWNSGFRARTLRRISSGCFSSGTPASGFTRFTLVTRWAGGTVDRTFRSISTSLRSATDSGLGFTNPMGVAVCPRKSRIASGMVVVADGSWPMGRVARGGFASAFFRLFFIAMEPPWMTEVENVRSCSFPPRVRKPRRCESCAVCSCAARRNPHRIVEHNAPAECGARSRHLNSCRASERALSPAHFKSMCRAPHRHRIACAVAYSQPLSD